jgi:hypothetical protein
MKKILCRVSGSRRRGTCAESRSTWLSTKNCEAAQHHNPHGPNLAHHPAGRCWPSIDRSTTHNALLSPPSQTLVYMAGRSLSCPPPPPTDAAASLRPPRLPPPLHRRPVHTPPSGATPPAQPRRPPPRPSARPSPRGEEQRWGEARWRIRPRRHNLPPGATSWRPPGADPVVVRRPPSRRESSGAAPPPGVDLVVCSGLPPGVPSLSLSRPLSLSLCVCGAGWWRRRRVVVAATGGGGGGDGWWWWR